MQAILEKKILLKDAEWKEWSIFVVLIGFLVFLLDFKLDASTITGVEQALFIILSAILFVFNDSIVGYKTITKIKDTLKKLENSEIKTKVLNHIGEDKALSYDEFIAQSEGKIVKFNKVIYKFKKKSYQLYMIFSLSGLLALILVLADISICKDFLNSITLQYFKSNLIDTLIIIQFLLIPVWVVSAIQAEKQKADLLLYLDGSNAIKNVKKYIEDKEQIDIMESMGSTIVELDD
ncbi:MAG: hypothetical protein PHY66_03345 [Aliarcobacter sp.]|nr:hypothetical protein [Aliarcobacter sp.]